MPKSAKIKVAKESRIKTKTSYKKYFLHYIYCLLIILLLLATSININNYISNHKESNVKPQAISFTSEKDYWESIVDKNPNYIDGYLQLAKVDVELGDKLEAQNLIIKALQLDPNNAKITSAQKVLGL